MKIESNLPNTVQELIVEYMAFQDEIPLSSAGPAMEDLVRFNCNKDIPVHRWFTFKEGFSADLLNWICHTNSMNFNEIRSILDPFCGVGTSLVSAQMSHRSGEELEVIGVEYNPFIRFVAHAKISWPEYRIGYIQELIPKLLHPISLSTLKHLELPELTTIRNPKVFEPKVAKQLLAYRHRIQEKVGNNPERNFFLLGWSAIIEEVSGVRKDGRALRFTKNGSSSISIRDALKKQWGLMLRDLESLSVLKPVPKKINCRVYEGDGRSLSGLGFEGKQFDLILYSPPYLNNIDYSEVYKLELWFSNYVDSSEGFRGLRQGTLRSHPSIKFPETHIVDNLLDHIKSKRLRESLLEALPNDNDRNWRERLIRGYMDDMFLALQTQYRFSKPGATVVCVVGNSLHGRKDHPIPIATDLIICSLAQAAGFTITKLQVARQLRRRDENNNLMRESIVFLKRPEV